MERVGDVLMAFVSILIVLVVNMFIVFLMAYVLPGVRLLSAWNAVFVAVLLGIMHSLIHYTARILELPLGFFTYFFTTFIAASIVIGLLNYFLRGFRVDGWRWGAMFSFLVAFFNALILRFLYS